VTMKAESEGRIYRNPRDPEHIVPAAYAGRVVTIRPRHRLSLALIGTSWQRIVEIIELGRRRTREVLSGERLAIAERPQVSPGERALRRQP
jgi:hypothetical protein